MKTSPKLCPNVLFPSRITTTLSDFLIKDNFNNFNLITKKMRFNNYLSKKDRYIIKISKKIDCY